MVPPPPWLNQGAAVNLAATGFYSQGGVPWLFRSVGNRAIWLETDGNLWNPNWKNTEFFLK
jgi:hypothetical protein